MTIESTLNQGILTVSPKGRIDSASGDAFSQYLNETITDEVKKISFRFDEVDFISSKGLRVLVSLYKSLDGKEMEILGANTSVSEIFRMSGFTNIFHVK